MRTRLAWARGRGPARVRRGRVRPGERADLLEGGGEAAWMGFFSLRKFSKTRGPTCGALALLQVLLSGNELEVRPFRAAGSRQQLRFYSFREKSLLRTSKALPEGPSRPFFGQNHLFPAPKMAPQDRGVGGIHHSLAPQIRGDSVYCTDGASTKCPEPHFQLDLAPLNPWKSWSRTPFVGVAADHQQSASAGL